jgi:hypothetical protein
MTTQSQQREMPFFKSLATPKYAPKYAVDSFRNYRDAVCWCWENRGAGSGDEDMDQAIAARLLGVNKGLFNRAVKRDSKGPVNLDYNVVADFEALCGWNAVTQWQARKKRVTILEEMQAMLAQDDRRLQACA